MTARPDFSYLVEVAAAVVISVAAALTAWVGFQASLWDGEQSAYYAEAGAARVKASTAATIGGQLETADLLMFQGWLDATAQDEPRLQAFYRGRFRPEFSKAFEAWLRTDPLSNPASPGTPFSMPEHRSPPLEQAKRLQQSADALFEKGQRANDISDRFVRGTVLLAIALFFGGICQTFKSTTTKAVLVLAAFVVCVVSMAQVADLPILAL